MGEIADMMLDGTLCEGCGVYLGGQSLGFPRRCRECGPPDDMPVFTTPRAPKAPMVSCPVCKRRVKAAGLADHTRDKHGVQPKC